MWRTVVYLLSVLVYITFAAKNPFDIPDADIGLFEDEIYSYRLPNDTRPLAYNVFFSTNIHANDFTFAGDVQITLVAVTNTSRIALHHRQLTLGSITLLNDQSGLNVPLGAYTYNTTTEIINIPLASGNLVAGQRYILQIAFSGTLRSANSGAGFYRSSYVSANGTTRYLATTQFQATDARHGFPCYDEPALRANFTIAIRHGSEYWAVSNMPEDARVDNQDGTTTTTFQTTPPTPTYLLAYLISDFAYIGNANNASSFQQRVLTRPTAIQGADFALQTGIDTLIAFEDYFDIPFSLPKMDQAAIPDFAAGAMENWGLVTYREPYLLYFNYSTFVNMRNVAEVIAHEYAHQWFGNLVTPVWWSYLWLNEGFATLLEAYATHWVFPHWGSLDAFVYTTVQSVLLSDASANTRPMTYYVESANAVDNLFDNVAYSKSGSVLRMFLHAFTEESFRKGLVYYLNEKAYSASDENDLFAGLERSVKEDGTLAPNLYVADIMSSWTRQAGFPILFVNRNYTTGTITLRQERYFTVDSNQSNSTWWIPLSYATPSSNNFSNTIADDWMPQGVREMEINVTGLQNNDWIIFNKQQAGFYRIQYDRDNYRMIADSLRRGNYGHVFATTRAQLIDDAFELARRERQDYIIFFEILQHLEFDTDYVAWASAFAALNYIDRLHAGSEIYDDYVRFILRLLTRIYAVTGVYDVPNEPLYRKQSRITVMNWACRLGLEQCQIDAHAKLRSFTLNGTSIHQNNLAVLYCNGMRISTSGGFNNLLNRLETDIATDERNRIIAGLGCSLDPVLLRQYLYSTIENSTRFRTVNERSSGFNAVSGNGQLGADLAIEFLIFNLDQIYATYGSGNTNSAITRIATFVVSATLRNKLDILLDVARTKAYITQNTINNALNTVAENQRWANRNQPGIDNWIRLWTFWNA